MKKWRFFFVGTVSVEAETVEQASEKFMSLSDAELGAGVEEYTKVEQISPNACPICGNELCQNDHVSVNSRGC
jgi:hypothetical protein